MNSGKIRRKIIADNYDEAVKKASDMLRCWAEDDHIIETVAQTNHQRELMARWDEYYYKQTENDLD